MEALLVDGNRIEAVDMHVCLPALSDLFCLSFIRLNQEQSTAAENKHGTRENEREREREKEEIRAKVIREKMRKIA